MTASSYIAACSGYTFNTEDILVEALTHKAVDNEKNYETLECIGDSLFNFIIKDFLRTNYGFNYSNIVKVYDSLVANARLADVLLHTFPRISKYIIYNEKGSLSKKRIADIFEALVGAIYVDSNDVEIVRRVIIDIFEKYLIDKDIKITKEPILNPMYNKSKLVEYIQHKYLDNPSFEYYVVNLGDNKRYSGILRVGNNILFKSTTHYPSKKEADIHLVEEYMHTHKVSFTRQKISLT